MLYFLDIVPVTLQQTKPISHDNSKTNQQQQKKKQQKKTQKQPDVTFYCSSFFLPEKLKERNKFLS